MGDGRVDLVARKLAALAGLGALRHLDLHLVRVHQVLGGHAEAARGHLLDGRTHRIAVGQLLEAFRLLAALAGVRTAAEAVHGDRQSRVRFIRDGAERHGAGAEALHDRARRFDLMEFQRLFGRLELEKAAQGHQPRALLVHQIGEFAVEALVVGAHRVLKLGDGLRRPEVILAAQAEGQLAADIEGIAVDGGVAESLAVTAHRFLGDLGQTDTFDLGRGAGEVPVDELSGQADGVEDLGAAIGLEGRDAHLGHHLEDALVDGLHIVGVGLLLGQALAQRRGDRR